MQATIIKTNRKWYLETVDNLRDLCKVPMRLSVENLIRFVPQFEYLERTKLLSPDMEKAISAKRICTMYSGKMQIFPDIWNMVDTTIRSGQTVLIRRFLPMQTGGCG